MTIAIVEAGPGSQPGHIDPELTDRPRPDRARDVLQLQSDRIQRPGQTIIVEQTGLDPEDLLHRPAPGPVLHPQQRRGRRQPIGHQRLDHLPVHHQRTRTARTHLIDDSGDIQLALKLGSDRQSAQTLLHHGSPPLQNADAETVAAGNRRSSTHPTQDTPGGRWETLSTGQKAVNRSHAKIRALVEQAIATLKSWRLLRKLRCSTTRITKLVQAVLTLHLTSSEGRWKTLSDDGVVVLRPGLTHNEADAQRGCR